MKLTIGKLAQQSNVTIETIRYYQRKGLLDEPIKTSDRLPALSIYSDFQTALYQTRSTRRFYFKGDFRVIVLRQ